MVIKENMETDLKLKKKKMTQVIEFIEDFLFYTLFLIGCGLVLIVLGLMWIYDRVFGKWEK
jgi:hypothetical protein